MIKPLFILFAVILLILTACGETTREGRLEQAWKNVKAEKYDKAQADFKVLYKNHPTDSAVLNVGAYIYGGLGQIDTALAYARKQVALYPKYLAAYYLLDTIAISARDYDQQLYAISNIGYIENRREIYWYRIAELNFLRGDYGICRTVCYEILKNHPDSSAAKFLLANALSAAGVNDSAIMVMERLHEEMPDRIEILSNLGVFYANVRQYARAKTAFEQLTRQRSDYLPGWMGLGNSCLMLGDSAEAIRAYRRVYMSDPTFYGVDSILKEIDPDNF